MEGCSCPTSSHVRVPDRWALNKFIGNETKNEANETSKVAQTGTILISLAIVTVAHEHTSICKG